jgi:hypothetical protein
MNQENPGKIPKSRISVMPSEEASRMARKKWVARTVAQFELQNTLRNPGRPKNGSQGRSLLATRWAISDGRPYRDSYSGPEKS